MSAHLNLREAIVRRVQGKSDDELRAIIEDAIGNEEITLPGLGVLFEMIWSGSEGGDRDRMLSILRERIGQRAAAT